MACTFFGACGAWLLLAVSAGCADVLVGRPATLFSVPFEVNGEPVGPALIDTGGGFEVMLRDPFDLELVGSTEVLAFGGQERVDITEPFHFVAGGIESEADFAIVGVSVCDCNGIGYHFFRNTGVVLGLDFDIPAAEFLATFPPGAMTIPFEAPPAALSHFDSSFIEVSVEADGESVNMLGLLDTGAATTVVRRGLVGSASPLTPDRLRITIGHDRLGTVVTTAQLFDTPNVPDLILGLDVMAAWSDRWYFSFASGGGTIAFFPRESSESANEATKLAK